MIKSAKKILIYVLLFVSTVAILLAALVGVAKIPREAIRENMRESAEYLCERGASPFFQPIEGVHGIGLDTYADSVLLGIIWQLDEKKPLESPIWASYYMEPEENANVSLKAAVENDFIGTKQYLRYWHGSIVPVKIMHLFWNLKQIYIFHALLMLGLFIWIIASFFKNKLHSLAWAFIVGLIAVNIWFVPFCLEYTWMFFLMLIISIAGFFMEKKGCDDFCFGLLFLLAGILAAYLDFLTTETITISVPLLIVSYMRISRSGKDGKLWAFIIKNCLAWGVGYLGMWASKWLIASFVLQENALIYVSDHIGERLSGDMGKSFNPLIFVISAIYRNIRCIFPFGYGTAGFLAGLLIIFVTAYFAFVYKKKGFRLKRYLPLLFLGAIPFLRYMVVHNHAYIHAFFTYRAQIVSISAVFLIVIDSIKWDSLKRDFFVKKRP